MLEYGNITGLPEKYRITLAISVALLLHTLVMASLPFAVPQSHPHRQTVQVELVNPGSTPSPDAAASPAQSNDERPPSDTTPEDPAISEPQPAATPEVIATRVTNERRQSHERQKAAATPPTEQTTEQSPTRTAPSRDASATAAGHPEPIVQQEREEVTQITQSARETDPYIARLAAQVGKELDKRPVPSSRSVTEPVTMEVELRVLGSGALTSAKITRSTGFKAIDQAVYQAALLASPYPRPPEEHSGRKRFRVELIFSPEQL